jgi:ATPase complex subunit ATP10
MSIRPLRTIRPILSQIHYTPYRPYSTPPNNSNEASSSSSTSKPVIPIPTPSQSEPLPTDKKPLELPQLPRPLGVALEPTSQPGTWGEKKERYLDEDRQKAKRKALCVLSHTFGWKLTGRFKEASQGYFHDYNKARKAFGGKLWTAPNTLIREDVCSLW